jgi:hypothetical protein
MVFAPRPGSLKAQPGQGLFNVLVNDLVLIPGPIVIVADDEDALVRGIAAASSTFTPI